MFEEVVLDRSQGGCGVVIKHLGTRLEMCMYTTLSLQLPSW